jgi:hypothetical protein
MILMLDDSHQLRVIDWKHSTKEPFTIEQSTVFDAASSRNGKYFAVATKDKS